MKNLAKRFHNGYKSQFLVFIQSVAYDVMFDNGRLTEAIHKTFAVI